VTQVKNQIIKRIKNQRM